jgi:cell wall-associated NlpC family hydrolase
MDLSPAQRKLAFAVIVLALAGLGAFLLWPSPTAARGQVTAPPSATGPPPARPTAATAPATAGPAPPAGAVNIYQWLPFSQADLAAAAGVVRQFCTDYATYSYTQSAASYVGRMHGLVTPSLAATLARGFATPGIAGVRIQQKQCAARVWPIEPDLCRNSGPEDVQHRADGQHHRRGDQWRLRRHRPAGRQRLAGERYPARLGGQLVNWRLGLHGGRLTVLLVAGLVLMLVLCLAVVGAGLIGGGSILFTAGQGCAGGGTGGSPSAVTAAVQPAPSPAGRATIPANYLQLFQQAGRTYGVPWVILAGIGKVESDDGRSALPGVHSGANAFGAAGPMQIGIGGAAGNTWGGAPVHPDGPPVAGVATDANGDGIASVYDPADAIAGAAKYLVAHGVQSNVSGAIFAYNHLSSYVAAVLHWASVYAGGGFTVSAAAGGSAGGVVTAAQCLVNAAAGGGAAAAGLGGGPRDAQIPNQAVATAITFARSQTGKPYLWGGTGPDAFDCSGLVMMAYRAAGVNIPRVSQQQWTWGPRVAPGHEEPGDLVFFAGSDGTTTSPGHVGMVIGNGLMVEAYATGFPIRIAPYGGRGAVGFTRPWARSGVTLTGQILG